MQLIFATNNQNKLAEVQKMVSNIEIKTLAAINCTEDIPETAPTIAGNAKQKADYVTQNYQVNCFADDTGLEIEALNGEPGVYSARYAGADNNADANMNLVLKNLQPHNNKKARFVTVIALNLNGKQHLFEGVCNGKIISEKRGEKGFGYDPIFVPDGFTTTFAEMTQAEKASVSHRGKAVRKLVDFLNCEAIAK